MLFLNGSGATLATSGLLIDLFTGRFDVVAHDQRGLGRTSVPPGPYSMAQYAADAAAVLDAVGWRRARRRRELRWNGRAGTCSDVPKSGRTVGPPLHLTRRREPVVPAARRRPNGSERTRLGALRPLLLDTRFTPEWLATHPSDERLAAMLADRTAPSVGEVARGETEQLMARSRHDVTDRLGAITCPTLVACGRYDGIAPVTNGEAIAARVPRRGCVYEGGHAFFVQDHDRAARDPRLPRRLNGDLTCIRWTSWTALPTRGTPTSSGATTPANTRRSQPSRPRSSTSSATSCSKTCSTPRPSSGSTPRSSPGTGARRSSLPACPMAASE